MLEMLGFHRVLTLSRPAELTGVPLRVRYKHLPMADGKVVDVELTREAVDFVVDGMRLRQRVLVMCNAGRNRTGLVVALALRRHFSHGGLLRFDGRQALEYLRARRPQAVANPAFERYIIQDDQGTPDA